MAGSEKKLDKRCGAALADGYKQRRVVVTGMGALTPLGQNVVEFWDGLVAGRSGIGDMTLCDTTGYPCTIAGEVSDFVPERFIEQKAARRMARFAQLAVAATQEALQTSGLDLTREDRERCGVLLGNGNGGYPAIEEGVRTLVSKGGTRVSAFHFPMTLPNIAASQISLIYGLLGYSSTVITACAAGTQGIGEAAHVIARGQADVLVAGGVEAGISQLGLAGFCAMKALSCSRNDDATKASRPFDAGRDGFVPAEGVGILILESLDHALNRGAHILVEVLGYGVSSDAYHVVAPDEDGSGAARAMSFALSDARVAPEDIDYINAHGTSTQLNDAVETMAIKKVFGETAYGIPISSTKSMIGHALGAAGGMEAVALVKTIQDGVIHPTINQENADPACDLDYVPNQARTKDVTYAMSNSFGFGGQNACLVLGKYQD